MIQSECSIDSERYKLGKLTESEETDVCGAVDNISFLPIHVDDTPGISVQQIKAKARNLNRQGKCGIVLIDYLQLIDMRSANKAYNREQEVSQCSRAAKIMAKELNVPIIALSQLSRAVEKQGNNSSHRPQLSDLRDSGSIEQDADCVLFLYRDSYYASQNPDGAEVDADTAECIVAKNRHGETSTVPLGWDGAHTRFMDVDFKR